MSTFVLVHGAWHGGWCWKRVTPFLRQAGYDIYTPTLTGLGDRSHLASMKPDLTMHIKDVTNLLLYDDLFQVVLVGHSYGVRVVAGVAAAMPERIAKVIYLDGTPPMLGDDPVSIQSRAAREDCVAELAAGKTLRPPVAPDFLGIKDPRTIAWVTPRLVSHPIATWAQPVPVGGKRSAAIPRAFIRCTESGSADRLLPFAEAVRARGWAVRELATGHDAMLTAPAELAGLLLELAAG